MAVPIRYLHKLQHPSDQIVNRVQDQLVEVLNPLIRRFQRTVSNTWTAPTLLNSWVNAGSGRPNAGYLLDAIGYVHVQGRVKSGASGTTAFQLPPGFRPFDSLEFPVVASNAAATAIDIAYLLIDSSGNVQPNDNTNTAVTTFCDLHVCFLAEQ